VTATNDLLNLGVVIAAASTDAFGSPRPEATGHDCEECRVEQSTLRRLTAEPDLYSLTTFVTISNIICVPRRTFSTDSRSLFPCTPDSSASGIKNGANP
jgi:hypothetical protein